MKEQYSSALHKLDELALAGKDPVTNSGIIREYRNTFYPCISDNNLDLYNSMIISTNKIVELNVVFINL